mmetsp:Transcript_8366/g.21145  ORF Transcript_8366/g.21145 Transcript_8366/m.21145 type:complete len:130 (-) Transcript_8366:272-661(-)
MPASLLLSFSHSVAAAPVVGVRSAAARRSASRPASAAYNISKGGKGVNGGGSRDFDAEDLRKTRAAADKEVLARVEHFTAEEGAQSKAKKSLMSFWAEFAERAQKSRGRHFDGRKTISGGIGGSKTQTR